LGAVSTDWSIVGWADFNGDSLADILWRNTTTGALAIWHLNANAISGSPVISTAGVATVPTT
jgi:hypothetical protein